MISFCPGRAGRARTIPSALPQRVLTEDGGLECGTRPGRRLALQVVVYRFHSPQPQDVQLLGETYWGGYISMYKIRCSTSYLLVVGLCVSWA